MKIIQAKSYQDMSRKAANIISAQVILKPNCVLGLATGATPIGTYQQLIDWYRKDDIDFSRVTTFNLDEYVGLSPDDPQSYHAYMREIFFDHVNLQKNAVHLPDGMADDLPAACAHYDAAIASHGGIDLQLLGIGTNGHIAFNEPGEAFEKDTHIVSLDPSTLRANRRFFASPEEMPRQAITMGIRMIMQAKRILLLADGEGKRDILNKALYGPISAQIPASILQLHPDLTVICHVEERS